MHYRSRETECIMCSICDGMAFVGQSVFSQLLNRGDPVLKAFLKYDVLLDSLFLCVESCHLLGYRNLLSRLGLGLGLVILLRTKTA